jgi:5'(3')-deoxyribonucleotidase
MVILCDVDGVVADLHAEWLQRYNERWGDNLKTEDVKGWGFHDYVKPECGKKVYDILHEEGLYLDVPDVVGAVEGVKALRKAGHRVVFVSSCVDGSVDQKVDWLRRHGLLDSKYVAGPDFVAANDKALLKGDVLIDDAAHNLEGTEAYPILFDAHHNQEANGYIRVESWDEIVRLIEEASKLQDSDRALFMNMIGPTPILDTPTTHRLHGPAGTFVGGDADGAGPEPEESSLRSAAQVVELRMTSETGGQKGQKLARFDLLPAGPLWELAEHYGKGAEKYDERNWERGYAWSLSFAALMRHAWAWWRGEDIDPENKGHHMAAVAFHAMALLEFRRTHPGYDDRPILAHRGGVVEGEAIEWE